MERFLVRVDTGKKQLICEGEGDGTDLESKWSVRMGTCASDVRVCKATHSELAESVLNMLVAVLKNQWSMTVEHPSWVMSVGRDECGAWSFVLHENGRVSVCPEPADPVQSLAAFLGLLYQNATVLFVHGDENEARGVPSWWETDGFANSGGYGNN